MNAVSKPTLVNSYLYKNHVKNNNELVCYVAGFRSKIKSYRFAITTLQKLGYDVLAFDYDPAVLEAGNPQLLIDVIDDITSAVNKVAGDYRETICMGVSLGSFIVYNVQKRVGNAFVGAFAAGGVSMTGAIFGHRTFKKIAQTFISNGYDAEKLKKIWKPLDGEPPAASFPSNKSFIVFEGMADTIVKYQEAKRNIQAWQQSGMHVNLYPLRGRGHLLTVIYFIRNTRSIITKAKQYHNVVVEPNGHQLTGSR